MQQLRTNSVSRVVSYFLIAALLAPQGLICLPVQAQPAPNVPAVVVVPFQDLTGQAGAALMREVTAAAALALEDAREYVVTSTTDLERELQALHLQPPLSTPEQIRLGKRLHADKVLVGSLANLQVDAKTGRARAELRLMLLDVGIGEYLDGAVNAVETKAIPGFSGDVSAVIHEALRQVAEAAVASMLSTAVRRGAVELVDDLGNININLGTDDGLVLGSDVLVMRPTWQPDIEQMLLRRIGVVRVSEVEAGLAVARVTEGSTPTTGDLIYRIYRPAAVQQAAARGRKFKQGGQVVAGLLLLLGLFAIVSGPTTASASMLDCSLAQDRPGATPEILLTINTNNIALDTTHGWLIYRSINSSVPTTVTNLIDVIARNGGLPNYSDTPEVRNDLNETIDFTWVQGDAEETGTVDANWNDPALVIGNRYFHRVRRIIETLQPSGSNPPIGSTQLPVVATLTLTPDDGILSDPSNACGPVTFFLPPTPTDPDNGAVNLPTADIEFTWTPSVGANEYIVQMFPASDPDGLNNSIFQSSIERSTGGTSMNATIHGPFNGNTIYYWRVGARQSGDPNRPINKLTGKAEWLYSSMQRLTTAVVPPPVPTSVGPTQRPLPGGRGGPWGTGRSRR